MPDSNKNKFSKNIILNDKNSVKKNVELYLAKYSSIAKLEMIRYKIPASITLAQGILESGIGEGKLAIEANNHFGIKCHKKWKGEKIFHDDDEKGECFRKYNNVSESFRDHSLFLTSRPRYDFLFKLNINNYKAWAKGLKKAGYATDTKYPQKLISLIERYNLYKYDKKSYNNFGNDFISKKRDKKHYVKSGDTLYSISKKYQISLEELVEKNNIVLSGKGTESISRDHATIEYNKDQESWTLVDHSSNGTKVCDSIVSESAHTISDGDTISFGKSNEEIKISFEDSNSDQDDKKLDSGIHRKTPSITKIMPFSKDGFMSDLFSQPFFIPGLATILTGIILFMLPEMAFKYEDAMYLSLYQLVLGSYFGLMMIFFITNVTRVVLPIWLLIGSVFFTILLMEKMGIKQDELYSRHANLE